jgi:hypothetical protein
MKMCFLRTIIDFPVILDGQLYSVNIIFTKSRFEAQEQRTEVASRVMRSKMVLMGAAELFFTGTGCYRISYQIQIISNSAVRLVCV